MGLEDVLRGLKGFPERLGLDLGDPGDRFKWFIASLLFAKRISYRIAEETFRRFVEEGLTTPSRIVEAGWGRLVEVLDSGGYVRYDFSTASNLLEAARKLLDEYGGDVDRIHELASDGRDLERRLMEFKGFGPTAVNIFLRELRDVWRKADPTPSRLAVEAAERLRLRDVKRFESKLVLLNLEYCKRKRCDVCPVRSHCTEPSRAG
ncbi:MAG: cytoplasmic protein [Candidatus Bathyarchaeota archaeon B24]|nr:MAG: cytoplasmic protein [Candidatus Bathyarchaeota archaeon B24]